MTGSGWTDPRYCPFIHLFPGGLLNIDPECRRWNVICSRVWKHFQHHPPWCITAHPILGDLAHQWPRDTSSRVTSPYHCLSGGPTSKTLTHLRDNDGTVSFRFGILEPPLLLVWVRFCGSFFHGRLLWDIENARCIFAISASLCGSCSDSQHRFVCLTMFNVMGFASMPMSSSWNNSFQTFYLRVHNTT